MSINRNLATFAKDVQTDGSLKGIAVTVTVAGGKFVIDGTSQQDMFLPKGVKFRLDVSDSTNANHPLRFSTTSNGTHGGGSAYTTGVTTSGTAGSSGAYVEVQFQQDAPDQLYYFCSNHSGMGAGAETAPVAVSSYSNSDVDSHLNQSNPTSGYVLSWNGSDYAWVDNAGYTDSDVDTHLNRSSASSSQILSWNGSDYAWVDDQSGSGGIASVAADSTPQLGGSLDVNGNAIVSASNGNIAITPNGSGKIILDGLSFPTSDGSADQVLKTDGSGQLAFVDQSGGGAAGGSLTATASGALTDGSLVAINADGTVSVIKAAVSQSIGTAAQYDAGTSTSANGNALFGKAAYDTNSNRVVVAYKNTADSGHGYAVVGTVSGSSISWGTPVEFRGAGVDHMAISFDSSSNKVLIVYRDYGNSYYGYAVVGTVSGSSISFGSATQFEAGLIQYVDVAFDSNANKHLVVYQDYHDNTYGKAIVGTISGTSVSFGSPTTYVTNEANYSTVTYDSTAQKFLVAWCKATSAAEAAVATISGTSVSFGSTATIASGYYQWMSSAFDSGSGKHIVAYASTGSPYNGNVKVGTISGTSVSFGSAAVVDTNSDSSYYFALSYNPAANKTLFVYNKGGNSGSGYYNIGTVSGTSISFSTSAVFEDGHVVSGNDVIYDPDSEKNILIFSDMDDNAKGKYIVFTQAVAGGATLTAENFIGISDGAYADSATATIQTAGAVDDAQSGLTAGQTYYVQAATGALGLSPDTISVVAGTAISATKLLINPDSDPTVTAYTDADVNTHLNVSSASANQKLSWNGSDYAWTDDATGSGSITATASGALANGDMVVLNSDGTVSVVNNPTAAFSVGSQSTFNSGSTDNRVALTYDTNLNKVVAIYQDGGNSSYLTACVGTVSGTSITWGSEVVIQSHSGDHPSATFDSDQNKVVIMYRNIQAGNIKTHARVGTVSGTSISFSSAFLIFNGQCLYHDCEFDPDTQRIVFFGSNGDQSYRAMYAVGQVSGHHITMGGASYLTSGSAWYFNLSYDTTNNKMVVTYRDNANTRGVAQVGTVSTSGNSISFGSAVVFQNSRVDAPSSCYDSTQNRIVISYMDYDANEDSYIIVGEVSGTSITFGTKILISTSYSNYSQITHDTSTGNNTLVVMYSSVIYVYPINVASSGQTATVGSPSTMFSYGVENYTNDGTVFDPDTNQIIFAYKLNSSGAGSAVAYKSPFDGSTNLTDENFLGVSNAAYANGATATIQTAGSVDDAQSSLTPAQTYFVQESGGIALTPSSPSVVAGTAISATQLLIKSGQAIEKPNTTQVVASGALSDGTKVCVNADGTVSAIASTTLSQNVGTRADFKSGNIYRLSGAVDTSTNKILVVYKDTGDGNKGRCVVGTLSGDTISFGTAVTFYNNTIDDTSVAYDAANDRMVVIFENISSYLTAVVGQISGTSITFGASNTFNSVATSDPSITYDANAQKMLITFYDGTNRGQAIVGTVSGSSISFGSASQFASAYITSTRVNYDPDSQKSIIIYCDYNNASKGTARVATISGTSVSFGTAAIYENQFSDNERLNLTYTNSNKSVIIWGRQSDDHEGRAVVATISGTSISFGTAVRFATSTAWPLGMDVSFESSTGKVVIAFGDNDGVNAYQQAVVGTISGTDLTLGSEIDIYQGEAHTTTMTLAVGGKVVISYHKRDSSSAGSSNVFQPSGTTQNLTATNYIGISDAAYTNGQTATIQVAGATDDAQSGLTAGQLYYVQNDGTLSTTADSPSVIAGTAVSATKLIVKG